MVKLPFYFGHEKLKITNPRKGTETNNQMKFSRSILGRI